MGSVCLHLVFSVWIISHTMKELCSFLCLLLVLPGSLSITQCKFKDKTLFDGTFDINDDQSDDQSGTSNDYGVFQYRKLYVWKNHEVNYMFDPKISHRDKREVEQRLAPVIHDYERKTCIKFKYHHSEDTIPDHHLVIKAKYTGPDPRCSSSGSVYLEWWKINMVLDLDLANGDRCKNSIESLIYHEMGHAMGIMHTQKRSDRKYYVIFDENCVDPNEIDQFTEIPDHHRNEQLGYECNSIMHYNRNTFKKKCAWWDWNCHHCNVLSPKPGSNCTAIEPSDLPTKLDWKLINIAQNCP